MSATIFLCKIHKSQKVDDTARISQDFATSIDLSRRLAWGLGIFWEHWRIAFEAGAFQDHELIPSQGGTYLWPRSSCRAGVVGDIHVSKASFSSVKGGVFAAVQEYRQ